MFSGHETPLRWRRRRPSSCPPRFRPTDGTQEVRHDAQELPQGERATGREEGSGFHKGRGEEPVNFEYTVIIVASTEAIRTY